MFRDPHPGLVGLVRHIFSENGKEGDFLCHMRTRHIFSKNGKDMDCFVSCAHTTHFQMPQRPPRLPAARPPAHPPRSRMPVRRLDAPDTRLRKPDAPSVPDARSEFARRVRIEEDVYPTHSLCTRSRKRPPTALWWPLTTLCPHVVWGVLAAAPAGFPGRSARSGKLHRVWRGRCAYREGSVLC